MLLPGWFDLRCLKFSSYLIGSSPEQAKLEHILKLAKSFQAKLQQLTVGFIYHPCCPARDACHAVQNFELRLICEEIWAVNVEKREEEISGGNFCCTW